MKSRWWIAASFLLALALLLQPGCTDGGDLPMESTSDADDPAMDTDMEMPEITPEEGGPEAPAEGAAEGAAEAPAKE